MITRKVNSILVSKEVFNMLERMYGIRLEGAKLSGCLNTFFNCREQGYVLHISNEDRISGSDNYEMLSIWVFEHRSSDNIIVIVSDDYKNMYDDADYDNKQWFNATEANKAVEYIYETIKKKLIKNC